jgi:protein-S-isoprenylcysteine O-methyltransferase Ste14
VKPDDRFRFMLMLGLLMLFGIGVFHRLRARTGERLDRKQEGLFILVTLRLVALAGMIALVAYLLNPANLRFSAVPLPDLLKWVGVGVGCIALCLLAWTLRSLGKNLTDTVVTRQHHTLVTTRPYRWVRHPFYVCAGLFTLAVSLITANALFLVSGGLILLLLALRTRVEEANLLNRFGDDYKNYMDRTGRFFPRF